MRRATLALAVLTLPLAACVNHVAGAPIGTGQTVDPNPPAASAPSGSSTPKNPPTPTIPDFPQAKDGTNIAACYDGTCEVELQAPVSIPMDPALGLATLTLERVDNVKGAQFVGTTTDGGTLSVDVYAEPGAGEAVAVVNGFTFVALATVNGRAVIRMSPPG